MLASALRETRATLALALPIVLGQVSQMLIGITDSVMIGHVGTVPLAASAFAGSIFGLFFVVGIGFLQPAAVFISRDHGGGDPAGCAAWLRHGLALSLALGAAAALAMGALGLRLDGFGQPPEVIEAVHPYYGIIAASLIPTLLFQMLRQYAESMGRPWIAMTVMFGGVGLNILLNWVLIYGRLGAPALGLEGAGWATLLSRMATVWVLWRWLRTDDALSEAWPGVRGAALPVRRWLNGLEPARLRDLTRLGLPSGAMLLFEAGAFSAAAFMMGWLGATALAAHQIALSCAAFTFMVPLGISIAVSMRIGKALGEGRRDLVRPIGFGGLGLSSAFMSTSALVFALAGPVLARGFVEDPEVVALAARMLVVAALFQLFDGAQVVGAGALRGLSDVRVPTVLTFVAYWLVALPGGYLLGVRGPLGPLGIWIALASGLAAAAVALGWRFTRMSRAGA